MIVKRNRDIGSPCLRPFYRGKGVVWDLFTRTEMEELLTHHISHLCILAPRPI